MATPTPNEFQPQVWRLEAIEAATLRDRTLAAGRDAWAVPVADGLATYCRPGSRLNKIFGLGFAPLDETAIESLAQAEQAYATTQSPVQIELSSCARPEFATLLAARGYQLTGTMNVLGRALTTEDHAALVPTHPIVSTRLLPDNEAGTWEDVLARGFGAVTAGEIAAGHDVVGVAPLRQLFVDVGRIETTQRWVAEIDGQAVGGASLNMRDGLAQLAHTATLPEFRGRGVQQALLATRMAQARQEGCTFAVLATRPGSASQRNAQRCGFAQLHTRSIWRR